MRFCASGFSVPTRRARRAPLGLAHGEIGERLFDFAPRPGALRFVAEADGDVRSFTRDAGVLDLLFAQQRTDVGGVAVRGLVERRLHVDLQQEMHAAAQIEAEIHREGADRRQPAWSGGQQIQRDDVVFPELGLQRVLRLELRVGIVEAQLDARGVERRAAVGNGRGLQGILDRAKKRVVDLHRGLRRRHLNRRHFRKEIRNGEQDAGDERDGDDDVFPERVSIHGAERSGRTEGSGRGPESRTVGVGCAEASLRGAAAGLEWSQRLDRAFG